MGDGVLDGPLGGLVVIALITTFVVVMVGGVLYQHEIADRWRGLVRRFSPPPPEAASGPPIERIAEDLRRVRAEVLALRPGTPMARRLGLWQAYDDLLVEAGRALGVPDTLSALPVHRRGAERLRVEHGLERAGMCLDDRPPYGMAG